MCVGGGVHGGISLSLSCCFVVVLSFVAFSDDGWFGTSMYYGVRNDEGTNERTDCLVMEDGENNDHQRKSQMPLA